MEEEKKKGENKGKMKEERAQNFYNCIVSYSVA